MKILTGSAIVIFVVGIFALFAGSQIASTEEGIANNVGNLLSNKWVATGLTIGGALLFASESGLLKKIY